MVPVAGVEPARCRHRWILNPVRLPIPSHRHLSFSDRLKKRSVEIGGRFGGRFRKNAIYSIVKSLDLQGFSGFAGRNSEADFESSTSANSIIPAKE